jgi:ferredoxin
MEIIVDRSVCICSGMCCVLAPRYFQMAEDGELSVLRGDASGDLSPLDDVVAACPAGAISLSPTIHN